MDIIETLKKRMSQMGLTTKELAFESGVPLTTLYDFLKGGSKLRYDAFIAVCRVLGIDLETPVRFAGRVEEPEDDSKGVPVLGQVWAGAPGHSADGVRVPTDWPMDGRETPSEDGDDWVYISSVMYEDALRARNHAVYGCTVEGDSMEPDYYPGDVVLVERMEEWDLVRDRDHLVVFLGNGDGYVLKELNQPSNALISINRRRDVYLLERHPEAELYGRVCGLFRLKQ